jgi:hypothetical protein
MGSKRRPFLAKGGRFVKLQFGNVLACRYRYRHFDWQFAAGNSVVAGTSENDDADHPVAPSFSPKKNEA